MSPKALPAWCRDARPLEPGRQRPVYEFVVTCDADAAFYWRFAGPVETGRHPVSDPAVGLPDRF